MIGISVDVQAPRKQASELRGHQKSDTIDVRMKTDSVQHQSLIKRAVELGAVEARLIKASSVVTAAWVRQKCQFGCGGYGSSLCCPPNSPTPETTRRIIDGYKTGILARFGENARVTKSMVTLEYARRSLRAITRRLPSGRAPASSASRALKRGASTPTKRAPRWKPAGWMCMRLREATGIRSTLSSTGAQSRTTTGSSADRVEYGRARLRGGRVG